MTTATTPGSRLLGRMRSRRTVRRLGPDKVSVDGHAALGQAGASLRASTTTPTPRRERQEVGGVPWSPTYGIARVGG